ncbi:phosphotransferase family protein [Alkalihalobacterium alkalinitrilicum]|uniref:phosphotransferase family protein n=1 Tax=Alkalihalobacterium alkalinitrilicum TaxID=427920 RepID=UPI00099572C5|nr:phosphotransferase family protein [Alkalihalobacterium alkalinitrilicum]
MNKELDEQLIAVRSGEGFDQESLRQFLLQQKFIPNEPLEVKQFPSGSSNLTYAIRCGEWEGVMRRPPFGKLPPKAHDMKREANLLMKIYPHFKHIPKPYVFSEDESILGVPFYIMERKHGVVIDSHFPPSVSVTEKKCHNLTNVFVKTLVELHNIDYKEANLEDFGKPDGFAERQVHGWIKRYQLTKTEEIGVVDRLSNWLIQNIPKSKEISIIHNDYKINNMLFSPDLNEVEALLDWEMATIADPIFDLSVALGYWVQEDDPDYIKKVQPTVTHHPGFLNRREIIELYATTTGKDVSSIHFYLVLAYFRLAVVLQQMHYRWKMGQTQDERFKNHNTNARNLIHHADEVSNLRNYI